jgi:regulator of sigma E protease
MAVTIVRAGATLTIAVTPGKKGQNGWLGVIPADETKISKKTAREAVRKSFDNNVRDAGMIVQTLWGLVTRETSPRQLMGPIGIAQLSGETAQLGWLPLASLMAMISLNLGLLNLFPIPLLDGGHIFIMALEGLARRDFSMHVKEKMLLAGFVVLMMLMVTVIYNDLTRISWIERLMPWR